MLLKDFKRIVTAFADREADFDVSKGILVAQIRDELIEARVFQRGGDLLIEEDGQALSATRWLINRVARLPLLAERILTFVPEVDGFVVPTGRLLDQPDFAAGHEEVLQDDAAACATNLLGRRPAGTASVLYLTSDAGEGKTTLINHLARQQALEFKAKRSDWLLVPIPLGGRTFLRFDDVVVGALVNRLRFQLLYYEAFLELVRLGVLVPAFDGFEEMIIESSSGEAISALGNLLSSLDSSGSVLVAARKAYFDYQSFKAQTRLFDAIGSDSVGFARLGLNRWNRDQFVTYAHARGLGTASATYDAVVERLNPHHPLVTRAVLIRRLVDVALTTADLSALIGQIGSTPQDYFFQFVSALIEREANEKWIDKSGIPYYPLLTIDEHHELLAMVAQEMWIASTDALRPDVVAAIADVFAEATKKAPAIARQIRERLKQHSLIVTSPLSPGALAFDHEDFRMFYVGEAVGRILASSDHADLRAVLRAGVLPALAAENAVLHVKRRGVDPSGALSRLQALASAEVPSSVLRESCGILAIGLAELKTSGELRDMNFPEDSLKGRKLIGLTIRDSYFQTTSLVGSSLENCSFINCRFERIELKIGIPLQKSTFERCDVGSITRLDRDDQLFDPGLIRTALTQHGIRFVEEDAALKAESREPDDELWLVQRVMRIFLRANQVNEDVIKARLGVRATQFIDSVLPALIRARVMEEVPYQGNGIQRRFRLGLPMHTLQEALAKCGGSFQSFLRLTSA